MRHLITTTMKKSQFTALLGAQTLATTANQMVGFIIPWLILSRTQDPAAAGVVAFFVGIAAVIGAIFGGVLVDHIGKRKSSVISDMLSAITVLLLPLSMAFDFMPIWLIVITQILGTIFDGPGSTAKATLLPAVARHDDIPLIRATSIEETFRSVATTVGPLLAGVLLAVSTESVTLLSIGVTFVICALLMTIIKHRDRLPTEPLSAKKAARDIGEGARFIVREPLLKPLTVLLVAWTGIYIPLSTIIFPSWFSLNQQGPDALGVFLGAQALGGVLGGLIFAAVSTRVSSYTWFVVSNIVSKLFLGALIFVQPGSAVAVVLSFLVGFTFAGSLPIINTAFFTRTPEPLLGRVNGANFALVLAIVPITSLLYGWLTQATSATVSIAVATIGSLLMLAIFCLMPLMRTIGQSHAPAAR